MSNTYFHIDQSLFDITLKYPATIPVFVSQGFNQLKDEKKRKDFGKTISLRNALFFRKLNVETFSNLLIEAIENSDQIDGALKESAKDMVKIEGLLPCPVRLPLTEALEKFISDKSGGNIKFELKAASMGLDWLKEILVKENDPGRLSDIFISAGFDLFFDEKLMGKFKKKGIFNDLSGLKQLNSDFSNGYIDLKDPKDHYSIIGVVPAVFMVNTTELKGRKIPESWEDILDPVYANSVSLPIGDFDLFNAILINIKNRYGSDGVISLGKSLLESMHPSQMVKSQNKKDNRPAVTIMPYFFTKMAKEGGPMKAVWPKDGAIISPIFMLSKDERSELLRPVAEFFASVEVGEILSHKGLFPSTNPDVDNKISKNNKFMWIGWDHIYSNDIAREIDECEKLFMGSLAKEAN